MAHLPPLLFSALLLFGGISRAQATDVQKEWRPLVEKYCIDCHDGPDGKGGTDLDEALYGDFATQTAVWEKTSRQLRARQMPPLDRKRPTESEYDELASLIESAIDARAREFPDPGRASALRRLTRTEYQYAIRDLLGFEVDASTLLPPEQSSHGFDNITVGDLPPALLDRYMGAAQKIARQALSTEKVVARTVRISPEVTQDHHIHGLPLGTRGGIAFDHLFPASGDYRVVINLMRDRNEKIEGLSGDHDLFVLVDGKVLADFVVEKPRNGRDHTLVDQHLQQVIHVPDGRHEVAVTFAAPSLEISPNLRQPYASAFNMHRHPRQYPAIYQISLTGPLDEQGTWTDRNPMVLPKNLPETKEAARQLLQDWMHLAYRGQESASDLDKALTFFLDDPGLSFAQRLEPALTYLLANPKFFLRVERDPAVSSAPYPISGLELASRLSFFLWSSLPDQPLLAASASLHLPRNLRAQVSRMTKDRRANALSENFAAQWLQLKNLDGIRPDGRLYPDFDANLREAMKQESKRLFQSVIEQDESILELLRPKQTFLNERLAKHYGIPGVYGDRMRPHSLADNSKRGGLLRQGSILTVTSYANRTSPVLRGHWILENLLGTPPPPAPPNIPALEDTDVDQSLPMRERLAAHREQKSCAHCHNILDPIGFSLENFDAIGQWRDLENESPVDASGSIPGGTEFIGVDGLERALLDRPEVFARTLTEKLMTYALGRGVGPSDAPYIRQIVRQAEAEDFRIGALLEGIVTSYPFTHRQNRPLSTASHE